VYEIWPKGKMAQKFYEKWAKNFIRKMAQTKNEPKSVAKNGPIEK